VCPEMRILVLILAVLFSAPAMAETPVARLDLIDGWQTERGTRLVAMEIALAPGWKTYWRSPGDAGIPPQIDWSGSRNIARVRLLWPVPNIYVEDGVRTIGYKTGLVLPLELTLDEPDRALHAEGVLTIGACEEVCVPVSLPFRLDASGAGAPVPEISAALAAQPKVIKAADLPAIACRVDPIRDGLRLTARLALPPQGGEEAAVFEHADAGLWISEAELTRTGRMLEATVDLVPPEAQPFALDRSGLRLTVIGSQSATEITGCPAG